MALSVKHEEFHVHPGVDPGKAVLCCGFLETGVQYSAHFRRNKHQLNPDIYWLSIYMEIIGQKSFFAQRCGSGIADRFAEDFQKTDF